MTTDPVAAGYDAVYAAMPNSPTLQRIWREQACGVDFPEAFYHISFVTRAELLRMAGELRVAPGKTFVDSSAAGSADRRCWSPSTPARD